MANTATAQTPIGLNIYGSTKVTPVVITFDTTASDLAIYTPASGNYAAVIGLVYREASAHNLTIKSGSTTLVTLEIAATDSPIPFPLGSGIVCIGAASVAINFNVSVAISTMLVYVAESSHFFVR